MDSINLVLANLPVAVKGCAIPELDGSYTIYVNSAYNAEQQLEIYNHEMTHIIEGHHHQELRSVAEVETEARHRAVLVERIKEAEEKGLPLDAAILRRSTPVGIPSSPQKQTGALPVSAVRSTPPSHEASAVSSPALLTLWEDLHSIQRAIEQEHEAMQDSVDRYQDHLLGVLKNGDWG